MIMSGHDISAVGKDNHARCFANVEGGGYVYQSARLGRGWYRQDIIGRKPA